MSGGAHLRGLAPGQHRNVAAVTLAAVFDLFGVESNPRLSCAGSESSLRQSAGTYRNFTVLFH